MGGYADGSIKNSKILSNIWFPYKAVTAKYKNNPSKTGVGMYQRAYFKNNIDKPMRMLLEGIRFFLY